jgi:hypothetical protein
MQTPILLLIFNRPDMSVRVFERIRTTRPEHLFIAADGPRPGVSSDAQLCDETRNAILSRIDWPCEVKTLFRNENLGCKEAVSSAITWFFDHVEEGIILEDDCLPDPSFFPYCEQLLERYRNDSQVMMISGNNFIPAKRKPTNEDSYLFSNCILIWGWASWRRAWQHYDILMGTWPEFKSSNRLSTFLSPRLTAYWQKAFDFYHSGTGTTWDVQWVYACWKQSGYGILPRHNMVENIGEVGAHMKPYDPCINIGASPLNFPLQHPCDILPDPRIDRKLMNRIYRSALATVWYIVLFLMQSVVSRDRNLWKDIRLTTQSLSQEIKNRSRL